jgi:hypothetical protein
MGSTTFVPTEAIIREAYPAFDASFARCKTQQGFSWNLSIEPLPPQIYARGTAENSLGLYGRVGQPPKPLAVCLLSPARADADQDEQVYPAVRRLIDEVDARARRLDLYDPYPYLRYRAPWQDVISSYGPESVAELRALQDRADPGRAFTNQVPGGFKNPSSV